MASEDKNNGITSPPSEDKVAEAEKFKEEANECFKSEKF